MLLLNTAWSLYIASTNLETIRCVHSIYLVGTRYVLHMYQVHSLHVLGIYQVNTNM